MGSLTRVIDQESRPIFGSCRALDQGRASRQFFGAAGRCDHGRASWSNSSEVGGAVRPGRASWSPSPEGGGAVRPRSSKPVVFFGRGQGGSVRLSKLVSASAVTERFGHRSSELAASSEAAERFGQVGQAGGPSGPQGGPTTWWAARPVLGPDDRPTQWGPVISYMTGPHTYVHPQSCRAACQQPVATR